MSFTRTLILNQNYTPHEIVDWKDAVTRMFNGKMQVVAQYDEILAHIDRGTLRTFPALAFALRQMIGVEVESIEIKVPAVAVLTRHVRPVKRGVKFSKTNVCLRDKFRCQYCGDRLPIWALSYDHVIPRSQGGGTVWENIVSACYACNSRKANRTPQQAEMPLLSVPRKPRALPMSEPLIEADEVPEEWRPYLSARASNAFQTTVAN
jgi:5-methylcytosine-specific restriction endonuclease McrA